jgi:hypothetical protein
MWIRGRYPDHGTVVNYDAHFVVIGNSATSQPWVWVRSTQTNNTWKRQPSSQPGFALYGSDFCSVLFMTPVPSTSNVKHYYRDLGTRMMAGGKVRLIRVTAAKPGEAFTYDWYIDPTSFLVVRKRTVVADAAPAPPNTSQETIYTYSGFGQLVRILAP